MPSTLPRVTILMCTRNGERHLAEQLASFRAQSHAAWDLWVSDDGSTDGTLALLKAFRAEESGRREVRLLSGPRRGVTANYLSLLCHPELPAGPVALSDQDDVWLPGKLERALDWLDSAGTVSVYGAQSWHTDAALEVIGRSSAPPRGPSFGNALVQNIVSGHSACLDAGALALVRRAGIPEPLPPYHDWWLYLLVSGAGGQVRIDPEPMLRYRQHGTNTLGAHRGPSARLRRAAMLLGRTYGDWVARNLAALEQVSDCLAPEHAATVAALRATSRRPGPARPRALARAGARRQTGLTTAALYLAAWLGRV